VLSFRRHAIARHWQLGGRDAGLAVGSRVDDDVHLVAVVLEQRSGFGWGADREVTVEGTRLARSGHDVPMRETEPPPSWVALLTLMVHGPDPEPTIRGAIRSDSGGDASVGWIAYSGGHVPVIAGQRRDAGPAAVSDPRVDWPPIRVWRDGRRIRIEEPDGGVNLIADGQTCWQFDRDEPAPIAASREQLNFSISGTGLLERRAAQSFLGTDFTRPTGPIGATTFLGRAAWTVELAPPSHKPHPQQLVIDAETGIVLQQRNDGFGSVEEWVEFVVGEPIDPALFQWDGPVRTQADQQAIWAAEHEAEVTRQRTWFAANVTARPLRVVFDLEVAVRYVHEFDEETGAFQASLGERFGGMLARRPRSQEPWELDWAETQYQWSNDQWDWAMTFHDEVQPTPASIEALKRQLNGH
jgi:hypothetical protein